MAWSPPASVRVLPARSASVPDGRSSVVAATTTATSAAPAAATHEGTTTSPRGPDHRWHRVARRLLAQPVRDHLGGVGPRVGGHQPHGHGVDGPERLDGDLGGAGSSPRLGVEAALHERGERGRRAGRHRDERRTLPGRLRDRRGEREPGQRTEGVDVGRRCQARPAGDGRIGVAGGRVRGGVDAEQPGGAEVGEHGTAVGEEEHVARGDVAVHHPAVVQVGEGAGQRRQDGDHLARVEAAAGAHERRQAPAGGELGDQGGPAVGGAGGAQQGQQVRVVEPPLERGLAPRRLCRAPARAAP